MWNFVLKLFHDLWFYGWPYLVMIGEVTLAIYIADKFFFEKNSKHFRNNKLDIEFREDHDKKDLPPVVPPAG